MPRVVSRAAARNRADELLTKSNYLDGKQKEMCSTHTQFLLEIGDRCWNSGDGGIHGSTELSAEEEDKYNAAIAFNDSLPSLMELGKG
jgi:hypothetical protein